MCFSILLSIPYEMPPLEWTMAWWLTLVARRYCCFMPRVSLESLVNTFYPQYNKWMFHVIATTFVCVSVFFVCLFVDDLGVRSLCGCFRHSYSALVCLRINWVAIIHWVGLHHTAVVGLQARGRHMVQRSLLDQCCSRTICRKRPLKLMNIGIAVLGLLFSICGTYQIVAHKIDGRHGFL